MKSVRDSVNCPVIAFGGVFSWSHMLEGLKTGVDALAVGNQFHYTENSVNKAKEFLRSNNVKVR